MAQDEFYYDDQRLQQLFAALDQKQRNAAIRGALRKAGNTLRKQAVASLRQSGLKSNRDVEKGIRYVPWKKGGGFTVTIGKKRTSRSKKPVDQRKAKLAIVPFWAEGGTEERIRRYSYRGSNHRIRRDPTFSTGRLRPYRFMEKIEPDAEKLHQEVIEKLISNIEKAANKAGGSLK